MKNFVVGRVVVPAQRFIDPEGVLHTQAADVKVKTKLSDAMKEYGKELWGHELLKK